MGCAQVCACMCFQRGASLQRGTLKRGFKRGFLKWLQEWTPHQNSFTLFTTDTVPNLLLTCACFICQRPNFSLQRQEGEEEEEEERQINFVVHKIHRHHQQQQQQVSDCLVCVCVCVFVCVCVCVCVCSVIYVDGRDKLLHITFFLFYYFVFSDNNHK